jgi:hypothetical protein
MGERLRANARASAIGKTPAHMAGVFTVWYANAYANQPKFRRVR